MEIYLAPFLRSFFVAIFAIVFILLIKGKKSDQRSGLRHVHKAGISRLGGIAIIVGFAVAILADNNIFITRELWFIVGASLAIMAVGILDDYRELPWWLQLLLQLAVVSSVVLFGFRINYFGNPLSGEIIQFDAGIWIFLGAAISIGWMLLMINSINWLDGIDGASGGVVFIGTMVIFFLSLKPEVNQPPMGIIAMSLAGAVLAFSIFNFHPARIMAGTSGSIFMGFALASFAIFAGAKVATTMLAMSLPLIDFFWVIGERLKSGKSIFHSDNRHLHHKLLEIGWSQRKISFFFYGATIVLGFLALISKAADKFLLAIFLLGMIAAFLLVINKKLDLIKKTNETA